MHKDIGSWRERERERKRDLRDCKLFVPSYCAMKEIINFKADFSKANLNFT
jgi:hypothetical protein